MSASIERRYQVEYLLATRAVPINLYVLITSMQG